MLHWVFTAVCGLSLVVARWVLASSCGVWASQCSGFSCWGAQTLGTWALGAAACGIFLDQGSNLCPLHGSQTLNHWTTREVLVFSIVNTTVLHDPQLYEFVKVEPWIWRNRIYREPTINYTWIFNCVEGQHPYLTLLYSRINCISFLVQLFSFFLFSFSFA